MDTLRRSFGFLVAILLAVSASAFAQTSLATLRGRVVDQQGGALPGASVTVRQIETNTTRAGVTTETGQFFLPSLPAGTYEILVELQGFSPGKRTVTLSVGQEAAADFTLTVGTVAETVLVTGTAALVETKSALGGRIDTKEIDNLPTIDRNFANLAQLAPGVTSSGGSSMGFAAAGQKQYQNQIFMDGATNAQQFYGTQAESYPQDWVQEFQVMTSGYSAEFGQATGGILNVITRSGSNALQGRGYGFLRNSKLDTGPFAGRFANGQPVFLDAPPSYHSYRIGGYLGGPLVRDRLFFFGGVEDYDNTQSAILSISNYWISQGYQSVIPAENTNRVYMAKVDANLDANNRLSIRNSRTFHTDTNCSGQGGDGCNSSPLWTLEKRATFNGPLWSVLGNLTSTLASNAFNEFRTYFGVNKLIITGNATGKYGLALLQDTANLPLTTEKTYPGAAFGSATTGGLEGENNFYVIDNFMYVKRNHTLKFGAQLARVGFFMDIDASQKGRWSFRTDRVFNQNDPTSYPFSLSLAIGTATYFKPSWNPTVFAQDTWQVRDDLTLNLGVRYDVDNTIKVGNELVDSYNQNFVKNYGGTAPLSQVKSDLNNVQPRLGIVWTPTQDRRTTVRGSAGLFYDQNHFNYNDTYINQTLLTVNRVTLTDNNPTANPFWNPADPTGSATKLRAYLAQYFPHFPDLSVLGTPQQTATAMDPNFHVPYTVEATAGFTHQFANRLAIQADYVYSHGYDMVIQRNTNLAQVNGQFVSIDPRFSAINMYQNLGWSRYHALVSRIEYRGAALRAGTSYTLSKSTSDTLASGVGGGAATNPLDLSIDVGPTNEDRRHVVNADFAYTFPLDFQLAGIARYQSALPFSVSSSTIVFARPEPRNSRRGDSESILDLRVSKRLTLGGRRAATIFWELFNATNTRNFLQYQGSLQSSAFGQPQAAEPMRRQQVGLRVDF
jgi:Carboxypeptidase regulatory-like domain/TonB dependent receptor/TonB-dependent Receptor Plug Domain